MEKATTGSITNVPAAAMRPLYVPKIRFGVDVWNGARKIAT
jgi:hypothetical protein